MLEPASGISSTSHALPFIVHQVLTAHLLYELAKSQGFVQNPFGDKVGSPVESTVAMGSKWQLYLEQLPRSYTTMCNWGPSDISELQFDHAKEVAQASLDLVREQWMGAAPVLRDLGG